MCEQMSELASLSPPYAATCTWAPHGPRAPRLQHKVAHLEEHAPLPGHQPHVPDLHKPGGELREKREALRQRRVRTSDIALLAQIEREL